MEQRFATSSVGHKCVGMCAYINRENVFSRYMQKEYKHEYRGKDDIIDTYILDATDRKYKRAEDLLNDYECSQFCKREDASVVRNWDFNLSNQFVVKNKDQTINKEETAKIVKTLINEFLKIKVIAVLSLFISLIKKMKIFMYTFFHSIIFMIKISMIIFQKHIKMKMEKSFGEIY